jgi:AcrR family transcriptional regulator
MGGSCTEYGTGTLERGNRFKLQQCQCNLVRPIAAAWYFDATCILNPKEEAKLMDNVNSEPSPKRAPRAQKTRSSLISASLKLFNEKPIDAVAIDEIVQSAGVAKGSFYYHFADRNALVEAIAGDIREHLEKAVTDQNAEITDAARRVVRAAITYFRFVIDEPNSAGFLARNYNHSVSLSSPLNHGMVNDISLGLRDGRFSVPTVQAGVLLVSGVIQTTFAAILRDPRVDIALSLSQQMCTLMLRSLGLDHEEATRLSAQVTDEIMRTDV